MTSEPTPQRSRADQESVPHAAVVDALVESGELALLGRGSVALSGRPLQLLRDCDARFMAWAAELDAREWRFPAIIQRSTLERAEFFAAFPHLATYVSGGIQAEGDRDPAELLSTAVCYHMYPLLAGRRIRAGLALTAVGECYRYEGEGFRPIERQWAFTMREIVFFGTAAQVRQIRGTLMQRAATLAGELDLGGALVPATDPFYTPAGRGRMLLQRIKGLKYELQVPGADGGLAVASFNDHEDFFGRAFDIRLEDGSLAHSGCVAFGLERWVYALVQRHGTDVAL